MRSAKAFAIALAMLYTASVPQSAFAQDIMVEEGGRPLKKSRTIVIQEDGKPAKKPKGDRKYPRGSSYVPNMTLPRTVAPTVGQPSPGVYTPPPINTFSDRVIGCNHSFPLNAGIGNNPTDRSAYVRQCAN